MSSPRMHAARFDEALQALGFYLGWWGGWFPIQLASWRADEVIWRQGPAPDLPGLVRWLDEQYDDEILLGMPQARKRNGGVGQCSVLWARIEGSEQLRRARAFKPRPSMVLQEGSSSRRLLLWALETPLNYFQVRERNRKIAYALGARQAIGDPDKLWIAAPGTCLRVGRTRPVPIVVGRLTTDTFTPDLVTARLKEPPDADAWREAR